MRRSGFLSAAVWMATGLSIGIALPGVARADLPEGAIATSTAPTAVASVSVARLLRDGAALRTVVMSKSAVVAAADARIEQARSDVAGSRLLPNPSFDVTLGGLVIGNTNPKGLSYGQTGLVDVGLAETIELGKRGPREEAAGHRLESVRAAAQATTQDAVGDAREALAKVAYYAARNALIDEGVAAAKHGATIEHVKLEHGGTSGADYDRLSLEVITLESEAARGKAELAGALASCQSLLHAPCDENGAGEDDLDAAAPAPAAAAGGDRVEERADILAVRKEAEASRADAALARARAIPDPTVRIGFTRDQLTVAGNQSNTLSLTVSLPLPIFDHGQHDAAKAVSRATELTETASAMTAGAGSDVAALRTKTAFLEKTLATMKKDAVPKAQSVVGVTEKAFADGQVGLTDLLLARRAYLGLRLSEIELSYEHFALRSALRRALGADAVTH